MFFVLYCKVFIKLISSWFSCTNVYNYRGILTGKDLKTSLFKPLMQCRASYKVNSSCSGLYLPES